MTDRSRRPLTSPTRTAPEAENKILALNIAHTGWGARKIKGNLELHGHLMPAASTVHAILKRRDRIDPQAGLIKPFISFEHEQPNDLWQMDFKDHVPMRKGRCHPLTLLDDHSRFFLNIAACGNEQRRTVQGHLEIASLTVRYVCEQVFAMSPVHTLPEGEGTGFVATS